MPRKPVLSRESIVAAAVRVADAGGLEAVSMRNVAKVLGVEAMSLYHHVAHKEALLDAVTEWVFSRIERPEPRTPWRKAMTTRAQSARTVLAAHPWALWLVDSRHAPGPTLLAHHDAVLANLRGNGFTVALAAQAFSALDAYVFGFVLTQVTLAFEGPGGADAFLAQAGRMFAPYPHLTELIETQVKGKDYDYARQFDVGLGFILDGLERARRAARRR